MDLSSSFWQIELEEESKKYVSFSFGGRKLEFCRLAMGETNSSASLTRLMNMFLRV